jgi:hypothetical protein
MINHIDLSTVLRRTVCDLYSNLVTRPTGAAVRNAIENQLAELGGRTVTVIDFSNVGLLDFSCADEVVAKLLLPYCADLPPRDAYFVFRGMSETHLDALEHVLARHRLALVLLGAEGTPTIVGAVTDVERRAWDALLLLGTASRAEVVRAAAVADEEVDGVLSTLARRRLVMRLDDQWIAVGAPL